MNEAEKDFAAFTGALLAVLLIGILVLGTLIYLDRDKIAAVQKARRDWDNSCTSKGGMIVTNAKGHPSLLCFGPDGRLISTR